ncbi:MAG TPA: hypothetical protein VEP28_13325, partial [Rubrobacter sp.]|nr:hypothetical protein [Rubrobacter sp.]
MPLRPYRWLHTLTGLCLGVCLAVPAGAQAASPAPSTEKRPIPTVVQKKLQKKIQQTGQGPLRYDRPEEAQEFLRQRRAPVGQKEVPVERYLAALEKMRSMPQYSTARRSVLPTRAALEGKGLSYANEASSLGGWTGLGPGNIGGRTRAFVINPEDARIMYAAGVAGGVWKSTNGGASWTPLGDFLPNI